MRAVLAVATLCLLAAVPSASAQPPAPALDGNVEAPLAPVGPEGAKVTLELRLHCPNQAYYMQASHIELRTMGPADARVEGPESVSFPEFFCLQQSSISEVVEFSVVLPANATSGEVFRFHLEAAPRQASMPAYGQANVWEGTFQLTAPTTAAPPAAEDAPCLDEEDAATLAQEAQKASDDPSVANVPGLGWLAPILGVALAAFARRR